jgi:type II secretory pathway component GspD/PulD (secretin)
MNSNYNTPQKGVKTTTAHHIFQVKLIPRDSENVKATAQDVDNNASMDDDMSDSDHDSISNEDRASGLYSKKNYRRNWVLRCDTAEELSVWVDIIRKVCPTSIRS